MKGKFTYLFCMVLVFSLATNAQSTSRSETYYSDNLTAGDVFQWKISSIVVIYNNPNYTLSFSNFPEIKNGSIIELQILKPLKDQNTISSEVFNASTFFAVTVDGNPEPQYDYAVAPGIYFEYQSRSSHGTLSMNLLFPTWIVYENGTKLSLPEYYASNPYIEGTIDGNIYTLRYKEDTHQFIKIDLQTGLVRETSWHMVGINNDLEVDFDLVISTPSDDSVDPILSLRFDPVLIWISLPLLTGMYRKKR